MFRFYESLVWRLPATATTFRGPMEEYTKNHLKLSTIKRIEVSGQEIDKNVYDSSIKANPKAIIEFMRAAHENKVEEISFLGCELDEKSGSAIGSHLPGFTSLKKLEVTSSQLELKGMMNLLEGVSKSASLEILYARSYNVECLHWSLRSLEVLKDTIMRSKSLKEISLPDNVIDDPKHMAILVEPYKQIKDKPLPTITGLSLSSSSSVDFNHENATNGKLDQLSRVKFSHL